MFCVNVKVMFSFKSLQLVGNLGRANSALVVCVTDEDCMNIRRLFTKLV